MTVKARRAVRNNNPGNIEKGAKWQGLCKPEDMTPDQSLEARFCVFQSAKYGFRAMATTIITYQDKRKAADGSRIDTIREVVERWAPDFENNTLAYIKSVDKRHPKTAEDVLDFHTYEDLAPLVKAMTIQECGGWFFEDADLDAGLRLAGVEKPLAHVATGRTMKAASIGAGMTGIGLLSQGVEQLTPVLSVVRDVAQYAPIVAGVIVLGVFVAIVWYRYDDWRRALR